MAPVVPVLRVAGPGRNVGKTWLARHLIEEFTRRGYAVGAIKRSHHPLPPDKPGADTDLFAKAGALAVSFGTSEGVLLRDPQPATSLPLLVAQFVGRADVVVVEGFKDDTFGAVAQIEQPVHDGEPGVVALRRMDGDVFLRTEMGEIARLVEACESEFALSSLGDPLVRDQVRRAAAAHGLRCPGMTLGVRIALAGMHALGIDLAVSSHRLSVTVETARCSADAIATVTGCSVGKRNLHVNEQGVLAALFTDLETMRAVRVALREDLGSGGTACGLGLLRARHAEDIAYRALPDQVLLSVSSSGSVRTQGSPTTASAAVSPLVTQRSRP